MLTLLILVLLLFPLPAFADTIPLATGVVSWDFTPVFPNDPVLAQSGTFYASIIGPADVNGLVGLSVVFTGAGTFLQQAPFAAGILITTTISGGNQPQFLGLQNEGSFAVKQLENGLAAVPEPSTWLLLAPALGWIIWRRVRPKQRVFFMPWS